MIGHLTIHELAELLGTSDDAVSAYSVITVRSGVSTAELQDTLGFSEEQIEAALNELDPFGVVDTTDDHTHHVADADISTLSENQQKALEYFKKFTGKTVGASPDLGIYKYHGIEGIQHVFMEVLEEAKRTGEDIYAFERNEDFEAIGQDFSRQYISQRLDAGAKAYVLTPKSDADVKYKAHNEGDLTEVKLMPDFDIASSMNIVGDVVMTFTLNPPKGTIRRDQEEAKTLKALFKKIWNQSLCV